MFTYIFLSLVIFGFLILAIQLFRGKWLRLIAGNTFGDLPKEAAIRAGRVVGWLLVGLIVLFGLIIADTFFHIFGALIKLILLVITITSFYLILKYLRHWVKTGK